MEKLHKNIFEVLSISRGENIWRLRVTSDSMLPSIKPGDYINFIKKTAEAISIGDILVIKRNDEFVTHRLIAIDNQGWITKGDRFPQSDARIKKEDILGCVVSLERRSKIINLQTIRWKITNRILAGISRFEATLYNSLINLRGKLFKNIDSKMLSNLVDWFTFPFRLVMRVLTL